MSADWPGAVWPDRGLLRLLEDSVMHLIATERMKRPSPAWKAFQLLNKRMPSLRLVLRVNNLIKHARERLEETGQSALDKLERQAERGDENAQKLLSDIGRLKQLLSSAKAIDWKQHERTLEQFSRTRSVELACNQTGPIGVRCYTRALELLLVDEYRHKPLRDKSRPLIEWVGQIGHPEAKSLLAFDDVMAWVVEQEEGTREGKSALQKREKQRERTRKHREWNRGKWVYLDDWIRLYPDEKYPHWRSAYAEAASKGCEVCGKSMREEPYLWFHRTRHVARCPHCQEAEWWADGYEIDEFGYPSSWLGEDATREERIAERTFKLGSKAKQWLQSPEGQAWLRKGGAKLKAIEMTNQA